MLPLRAIGRSSTRTRRATSIGVVKPVEDVEEGGGLLLIVGRIKVRGQDHKQRIVDLRLRPQSLDQADAVALRELQIDQNSGIRRRRHARNRLVCRKRDVGEKSFLAQPIEEHDRRLGIVLTKQYTKRALSRRSEIESDRTRPIGEIDVKNRAPAGGVLKADLAVEPIDDLLDDAQPEAGAALLACVRGVGLGELLENMGLEFVRNTMAMVSHRDTDRLVSRLDRDDHFFTGRRKLDGV